jgi:DNA-binding CsgD family transcriptional regulator
MSRRFYSDSMPEAVEALIGVGELNKAQALVEPTATELRVAELIANGVSNKAAAAELFVTVRTIESTLTKIYAKLGVSSRTRLAARAPGSVAAATACGLPRLRGRDPKRNFHPSAISASSTSQPTKPALLTWRPRPRTPPRLPAGQDRPSISCTRSTCQPTKAASRSARPSPWPRSRQPDRWPGSCSTASSKSPPGGRAGPERSSQMKSMTRLFSRAARSSRLLAGPGSLSQQSLGGLQITLIGWAYSRRRGRGQSLIQVAMEASACATSGSSGAMP